MQRFAWEGCLLFGVLSFKGLGGGGIIKAGGRSTLWLEYAAPDKAEWVQFPVGPLPHVRNRVGRCRKLAGSLGDLPFETPMYSDASALKNFLLNSFKEANSFLGYQDIVQLCDVSIISSRQVWFFLAQVSCHRIPYSPATSLVENRLFRKLNDQFEGKLGNFGSSAACDVIAGDPAIALLRWTVSQLRYFRNIASRSVYRYIALPHCADDALHTTGKAWTPRGRWIRVRSREVSADPPSADVFFRDKQKKCVTSIERGREELFGRRPWRARSLTWDTHAEQGKEPSYPDYLALPPPPPPHLPPRPFTFSGWLLFAASCPHAKRARARAPLGSQMSDTGLCARRKLGRASRKSAVCAARNHLHATGWFHAAGVRPIKLDSQPSVSSDGGSPVRSARLAGSLPIKANRAQSPAGPPDFRKWESCRTMPFVRGPSRGSPVSSAPPFRRCFIFTSITLIGSQRFAFKSRPNLFNLHINNSMNVGKLEYPEKTRRPTPTPTMFTACKTKICPQACVNQLCYGGLIPHDLAATRIDDATDMRVVYPRPPLSLDVSTYLNLNIRDKFHKFATSHRAGRWSAGFLGDLPSPPPPRSFHSSAAPYSPLFTLIGSQDFDVRTLPKSIHSLAPKQSQPRTCERLLCNEKKGCKQDILWGVLFFSQHYQWRVVNCCKARWSLLTAVHSRCTQQEPVTTMQPRETECIPTTHKRAARDQLHASCDVT
ncbi:hypothetical protein PR048_009825 [Dryococelus australis]|uniref:Uncharacterized protein n=1 Tax=Dryococelus australis TaxID=614101 RepID=A0ABQ9I1E4_9NEOP|nr:hypothetical protein PR048_009825 [Dryococelus australis]